MNTHPQGVGYASGQAHRSQPQIEPSDTRWITIHDLFCRAIELPLPAREEFLDQCCSEDAQLRAELEALIGADCCNENMLVTAALEKAVEDFASSHGTQFIGTMAGSYKLVSMLGHGGAGAVYLAERVDQQYSAHVAIKIVESAFQTDVLERFRAERQILARLHHSYIARLIDAGETANGLPFLVMEYVRGEPIDRYCESRCLTLEQRLLLFLKVCEVVQFAHQNLIVHRDLKPSNVLVTADGTPKLLDFGIAKLLDTNDGSALALTRVNDRMLTTEYASPEQIMGRPVTTSSDVYALGVVLHELLTGIRPHEGSIGSQIELERSICFTDPAKPSLTVTSECGSKAATRSTTSAKLRGQLAGDLDAILLRALRKEPERRYGSVEQFSTDVHRYLIGMPVLARQGNFLYYTQRFLGRHLLGVCTGTLGACLLIAFTISTSVQSKRIAAERDRAEIVSGFMLDVFSAADPLAAQGHEITARELLDKAGARIKGELNQQPEVRARLLEAIGLAYYMGGQSDRAAPNLREALRLRRQIGGDDAYTAQTLTALGRVLRDLGDFSESAQVFTEATTILQRIHRERTPEYAKLLKALGRLENTTGKIDDAERHLTQGLILSRALYGPSHPEVADLLWELSGLMLWKQRLIAAERLAKEASDIYHSRFPETHPDRIGCDALLGEIFFREGKIAQAALILEQSLTSQRVAFGTRSSRPLITLSTLSDVRLAQHRFVEAEALAREALETSEALLGAQHFQTGWIRTELAEVLMKRGRYHDAESQARSSLETLSAVLPTDHQYIASAEYQLGLILIETHQLPEAIQRLDDSMRRWERSGARPWRAARSESALGEALFKMGNREEAEPHLITAYQTLAKDLGENDGNGETTRTAFARLEHFYEASKKLRSAPYRSNNAGSLKRFQEMITEPSNT